MSIPPTLSLFSEQLELEKKPYSFAVSIVAHIVAIAIVAFGILSVPPIRHLGIVSRYTVRHMNLQVPEPKVQHTPQHRVQQPRPNPVPSTPAPGVRPAEMPKLPEIAKAKPAPQTLIQPDVPKPVLLNEEIPLPTVVVASMQKLAAKEIVPPKTQVATAAIIKPSLQKPTQALKLADMGISASDLAKQHQPIFATTSAPIVVRGPDVPQAPTVSTTAGSEQATSATVISLSNLHMPSGRVSLPPVNQVAASKSSGEMGTGNTGNTTQAAIGGPANNGSGTGDLPATKRITMPREGQFSSVVVGSAINEKYPETVEVWGGRMAYTAYLRVGLEKSWIFQYSLAREDSAPAGGPITHIEAPWPYTIVRPNLEPGSIDADALMVHGYVNQAGHFEGLRVVFPPLFAQAQFVLNSLALWEFRPATQNGKNIKVEVLLIIPDIPE